MKVIIITGQTATGKTSYAIKLAQEYNGELINYDSRQIYKGLDIITGKDLPRKSKIKNQKSKLQFKIQKRINNFDIGYYKIPSEKPPRFDTLVEDRTSEVKLWLYDIADPKQYFSSYDYVSCALLVIKDILLRGKTPIIVGGTYFYLYHLLYNVETQHIGPDWELRNKLNKKSVKELQKIFQKLSLQSFNRLNNSDKNNPQRLIRKIEIARFSPHLPYFPLSHPYQITLKKKLNLKKVNIQCIGLRFKDKEKLREKITNRVEERLKNKAVDEVKNLIKIGYHKSDPGLKTIGYTQIIEYLKGKITKKQAIENWISKELQYAKRQYTFMKKNSHIVWREIT